MNEELAQRFTEDYARVWSDLADALGGEMARENASAILHKLLFLAYLERARLLDGNPRYLWDARPREGDGVIYDGFLVPLVERIRRGGGYDGFGSLPDAAAGIGSPLPRVEVSDKAIREALAFLGRYRFRLDEDPEAITPDLLGCVQERFIDQREHRSYYTRPDIARTTARWVIREALMRRWGPDLPGYYLDKEIETAGEERALALWRILHEFAVIDPSCGSGAFLLAAFDALMEVRLEALQRLLALGVHAPEGEDVPLRMAQSVLARNLYGVELSQAAADVARMRLFLQMLSYRDPEGPAFELRRIPDHIVTGNALVGLLHEGAGVVQMDLFAAFTTEDWLNRRLLSEFRAAGARIEEPVIDAGGSTVRTRRRVVQMRDIRALQPVHWSEAFPEVFARGGFDAVLGNPPWDSFRANAREWAAKREPRVTVRMGAGEFEPIWRAMLQDPAIRAAWAEHAGRFSHVVRWWAASRHLGDGQKMSSVNLYVLFLRQAHNILRDGGLAGCVVPSGALTDAACTPFREVLFEDGDFRWGFAAFNHGVFGNVADKFRFCVLCFGKGAPTERFHLTVDWTKDAADGLGKWLDAGYTSWTPREIRALYPHTLSIPLTVDMDDVEILRTIARHPPAGSMGERMAAATPARMRRGKETLL